MKPVRVVFAVAVLHAAIGRGAGDLDTAVQEAVRSVQPSVVRLHLAGVPDRSGQLTARTTTGVVVSETGDIITSSFGFSDVRTDVIVETSSGQRHAARVVAQDHLRKLVLLHCEADDLTVPVWADSEPEVGTWAVAVGRFYPSPLPSAALGIISARNRIDGMALQTDARVSPVNYGGPLVGLDGQVFGILVPLAPGSPTDGVSAGVRWYDSGIAFAIPAADVHRTIERLRSGKDRRHGQAGFRLASTNPLTEQVLVESVIPQSPAAEAGIRPGDRIAAVSGRPVPRVGVMESFLRRTAAGESLRLTVERNDQVQEITVSLVDRLPHPAPGWLGLIVLDDGESQTGRADPDGGDSPETTPARSASKQDAAAPGDANPADRPHQGVRVAVLPDSPAARAGLPPRCRIITVNGRAATGSVILQRLLHRIPSGKRYTVQYVSDESDRTDPQSVPITAEPRQTSRLMKRADDVSRLLLTGSDVSWKLTTWDAASDIDIRMLVPEDRPPGLHPGVIIFLSAQAPKKDRPVRRWRAVCEQQELIFVEVRSGSAEPVTDPVLIGRVLTDLAAGGLSIDQERIALITDAGHADFTTRLLRDPRLSILRNAVYLNCHPVVAGASLEAFDSKQAAVLLSGTADDAQSQALRQSAVDALTDAGADVVTVSSPELAQQTARWLLTRKIR